ncbi:unnamed protein product [Paramecium pentaurelia]|uniref:Uncharacterized protein n=1 Tax=Paramecium pentaurelia TaxID=43138 RepID=A0A8S1TY15_9CILI|nr:unnamed protein product [Paramecium pentaurelia]
MQEKIDKEMIEALSQYFLSEYPVNGQPIFQGLYDTLQNALRQREQERDKEEKSVTKDNSKKASPTQPLCSRRFISCFAEKTFSRSLTNQKQPKQYKEKVLSFCQSQIDSEMIEETPQPNIVHGRKANSAASSLNPGTQWEKENYWVYNLKLNFILLWKITLKYSFLISLCDIVKWTKNIQQREQSFLKDRIQKWIKFLLLFKKCHQILF